MIDIEKKMDLVKAIMQIESGVKFHGTCYNYDHKGGIQFAGYKEDDDGNMKPFNVGMCKSQVDCIIECDSITEICNCYKEMEYF